MPADSKHPCHAAFESLMESRLERAILPALPGLQSALGIEVEKHIVPAMGDHPVTDGDGLGVVGAGMGEENT
jgi:hypothetical protein